jgi:hypothetical protein
VEEHIEPEMGLKRKERNGSVYKQVCGNDEQGGWWTTLAVKKRDKCRCLEGEK